MLSRAIGKRIHTNLRLKKAAELLHTKDKNISEIAYTVGFNSLLFTASFTEYFGIILQNILKNTLIICGEISFIKICNGDRRRNSSNQNRILNYLFQWTTQLIDKPHRSPHHIGSLILFHCSDKQKKCLSNVFRFKSYTYLACSDDNNLKELFKKYGLK